MNDLGMYANYSQQYRLSDRPVSTFEQYFIARRVAKAKSGIILINGAA